MNRKLIIPGIYLIKQPKTVGYMSILYGYVLKFNFGLYEEISEYGVVCWEGFFSSDNAKINIVCIDKSVCDAKYIFAVCVFTTGSIMKVFRFGLNNMVEVNRYIILFIYNTLGYNILNSGNAQYRYQNSVYSHT